MANKITIEVTSQNDGNDLGNTLKMMLWQAKKITDWRREGKLQESRCSKKLLFPNIYLAQWAQFEYVRENLSFKASGFSPEAGGEYAIVMTRTIESFNKLFQKSVSPPGKRSVTRFYLQKVYPVNHEHITTDLTLWTRPASLGIGPHATGAVGVRLCPLSYGHSCFICPI